jgi:pseudouridine kinase
VIESCPVVVVGGINLDTLARVLAPLVTATSNPGRTVTAPGGVGRNVAENLARLGSPVRLVGAVGQDHAGDLLLAGLADLGVDTTAVRRRTHESTGTYTAVLDDDGSLVAGVADMACTDSLSPGDLPANLVDGAAWLVLDGNLRTDTIEHCLTLAQRSGVPAALDPVGVAKAARLGPVPGVHTFTPNAAELVAWSGIDDQADAIALAHQQGVQVLWLRAGAAGSTLYRPGYEPAHVRLPPASVLDVTGAGDAMLAAYVHRLRDPGRSPTDVVDAAWFATAAAWLTVGSPSAVRPDLTEALVAATLDEQRNR